MSLGGERLLKEDRLRRRPEYQHCYRQGQRRHSPLATLHYVSNELTHPRLGITATRKVGGSVVRQKLKRRIREIYRRWPGRGELPAADLVVHLKPAVAGVGFAELEREILRLLRGLAKGAGR